MDGKQKCMIIGAVPIRGKRLFQEYNPKDYYVICADAGYETALKHGIRPDMIVGDFDSAKALPPEDLNCLTLPVKKDVTDTMYAAMRGLQIGFREFLLLGCLGGKRFDHSIANLEVMNYITAQNCTATLADETTKAIMIHGRRIRITDSIGDIVSVYPYGGTSCSVSYHGLEYPLHNKTLSSGKIPMGVSNRVMSDPAEIMVHTGTALIILYRK